MEFHGTDTSSSMEFIGTWSAPISMTRAVPWNSMDIGVRQFQWHEKFHGIPWNSMELRVCQFPWHEQFHGVPWNSTELGVRQFRWHEQFRGIPWNSMELQVRQFRWHEQFHGIYICVCVHVYYIFLSNLTHHTAIEMSSTLSKLTGVDMIS